MPDGHPEEGTGRERFRGCDQDREPAYEEPCLIPESQTEPPRLEDKNRDLSGLQSSTFVRPPHQPDVRGNDRPSAILAKLCDPMGVAYVRREEIPQMGNGPVLVPRKLVERSGDRGRKVVIEENLQAAFSSNRSASPTSSSVISNHDATRSREPSAL